MIIAISGSVGTGKTVVAELLGKKLKWKVIDLNSFAKEKGLVSGYDKKRGCDIVDVERIDEEIQKEGDVIIESHYAHDIKSDVVVILRTNPGELRNRLKERKWKDEKIEENVLSEIMEVCLSEALETGSKVLVIDTTKKTTKQVVDEIIKQLKL
ncbi:MAG: adenylate kinase family protein [Candidatus Aenigmatarchaeota archaeon]